MPVTFSVCPLRVMFAGITISPEYLGDVLTTVAEVALASLYLMPSVV